jgi:hypothetical protein
MDAATIISFNIPGVSNALLFQDSVVGICHAMTIFTSIPPTSPVSLASQTVCTIMKTFGYFLTASEATNGFTWVTHAIRSGIPFSVLRSALWSRETARLMVIALDGIVTYTVYRPILRVIGKVLLDPGFRRLESRLQVGGEFQKQWAAFKATVQENLAIKAIFDEGWKYSQSCSAAKVSATPSPVNSCSD